MIKRLKNRLISTLLILSMMVCAVPASSLAAEKYEKNEGYGGQLTDGQKAMYDAMVTGYVDGIFANPSTESAKCSFSRGSYVVTQAQFQTDLEAAFVAFIYDYPQVFWMEKPNIGNGDVMALQNDDQTIDLISVNLKFTETYEGAKALVSDYNQGLKAAADEIHTSVGAGGSEYDYYLEIHDWLCEKLTYNNAALNDSKSYPEAYTSGPVFAGNGSVTCQGYSEAFKALCDVIRYYYDVELYAASVVGTTKGNARHMWNCAYLNGNWYGVDVQFDDQGTGSHNYFMCGANTKIGSATYASEHVEKQSFSTNSAITFAYPVLASEKYEVPVEPEKPEVEKLAFSAANLVLQDDLTMNFKVKKALFTEVGYEDPYVEFEFNGEKTTVKNYSTDGDYYVFRFEGISPNQMNDTIKATLSATYDGAASKSEVLEYSVAKYCYDSLERYSSSQYSELRTLLVDLLRYGAKSQIYTDYKVNNLVDAKLTSTQASWGTSSDRTLKDVANAQYKKIDAPTVRWKAVGLNLRDNIVMRFKFATDSISNLKVKISKENGEEWTIPANEFVKTNGGYYVYFDGLNAGELSETVYVTVYNGSNAVSNTLSYSVESYAYAKQNDADSELSGLVKAMMKYGDSAAAYAK